MKTSSFLPAGSSFTQVFDTRGMRRYFDLQVFKEAAAFGFAHLLIRNKSIVPFQSTFQILLERLAQKGAIYQGQGRLQKTRGRGLPSAYVSWMIDDPTLD